MDVSTDTAALATAATAAPSEAIKATSQPELGDEGAVADNMRPSSREAAKPSGEATRSPSGDEVVSAGAEPPKPAASQEAPRAEGEGAPATTELKPDDAKTTPPPPPPPPPPPADAEVASQTEECFEEKTDVADKAQFNAEPDAPAPTRPFTFKVGRLA
ncbi:uncharacterized protein LOC144097311 [Amblyomma americanum]